MQGHPIWVSETISHHPRGERGRCHMGESGSPEPLAVGALQPRQHPWSIAKTSERPCAPVGHACPRPSLRDFLR
jgi:hypothetical protein